MSNQARAAEKPTDTDAAKDAAGGAQDTVLIAVRKLTERAKANGSVTYDDINEFLPEDQVSSDQIEDVMAQLSEAGVTVTESENADAEKEESTDLANPTGNIKDEDVGRTDDPVRMYLREMGSVELLSREGEIAIAKRIEAGREDMIAGICESPLTFSALMSWRQSLQEEVVLLRDVIDLDATYAAYAATDQRPQAAPRETDSFRTVRPETAAAVSFFEEGRAGRTSECIAVRMLPRV